jgi:hypothetical protein
MLTHNVIPVKDIGVVLDYDSNYRVLVVVLVLVLV